MTDIDLEALYPEGRTFYYEGPVFKQDAAGTDIMSEECARLFTELQARGIEPLVSITFHCPADQLAEIEKLHFWLGT